MKKMWAGRTAGELNKIADKFNASIPFDQRLVQTGHHRIDNACRNVGGKGHHSGCG